MAEPGYNAARRVLHVHPPSAADHEEIAQAIADAGCAPIPCPDVYRALAGLGRGSEAGFGAVVVSVDRLDPAEFEFFQLAARHHRRVPVYVYGQRNAAEKVRTALRLGARQVVDAVSLRPLLGPDRTAPPAPSAEDRGAEPPEADAPALHEVTALSEPDRPAPDAGARPIVPLSVENDEPAAGAAVPAGAAPREETYPDDEPPGADDDSVEVEPAQTPRRGAARVPWLRYDDAPQRTPPRRITPAAGKPASAPAGHEPEAPLLSPEELQALLADDEPPESTAAPKTRRRK